jgi:glycosyltransferase involved in cell wall biosynthesis
MERNRTLDDGWLRTGLVERRSYAAALTDAIEAWSAHAVRQDASAFRWRQADLRYAVERHVYFALVNDKALQAWFDAGAASRNNERPDFRGAAAMVAPFFAAPAARESGAVTAWCALRLRWTEWRTPPSSSPDPVPDALVETARVPERPTILFLVLQPKFVRFLLPVAQSFGTRAAFLTIDDPVTEAYLAGEGLPAVNLRLDPGERARPTGVLGEFDTLCSCYDRFWWFIDRWLPHAIIVPEGNSPLGEAARRAAARRRVPTICVQHGWSPVSHPGFRNMSFERMLVWGGWFAEALAAHNPKQRFVVTGSPAIASRQDAGPRAGQPIRAIGFFLQKGGPLIGEDDWWEFLDLVGWAAERFPDIQIVIRDHPSTAPLDAEERARIGRHANLRFMPPGSHALAEALAACDIVVAAYSTTLLEALAVGAIPVIFGASGLARYWPDLVAARAAVEEKTLGGAKARLLDLVANDGTRTALRQAGAALRPRLFAATGTAAVARIAAAIGGVAKRRPRRALGLRT